MGSSDLDAAHLLAKAKQNLHAHGLPFVPQVIDSKGSGFACGGNASEYRDSVREVHA